jgi:micrococcal nuclease
VAKAAKKATKSVKKADKAVKKAATATKKAAPRAWVEPQGQVCPLSHPIKAKLASSIYHLPGMFNYTRTRPDRCYASEAAAKRDGLTPAKR